MADWVGAVSSVIGAGVSTASAVTTSHATANARKDRERVQASERNAAVAERQKQREALNKANARTPDPEALLAASLKPSTSPLLSSGVTANSQLSLLQLGRLKLLGE